MTRTISEVFAWFRRQALSYLVIVAILVTGAWLHYHGQVAATIGEDVHKLNAAVQALELSLQKRTSQLPVLVAKLKDRLTEMDESLQRAVAAQRTLERERAEYANKHRILSHIPGSEPWLHLQQLNGEINIRRLATAAALRLKDLAEAGLHSSQAIEALQLEARAKRDKAQARRVERRRISQEHPWKARLHWTQVYREIESIDQEIIQLEQEALDGEARAQAIINASKSIRELADLIGLQGYIATDEKNLATERKKLTEAHEDLRVNPYYVARQWINGRWKDLRPILWIAAVVLVLAIAGRIAIKVLLYYVVAPFAERCAAIRLLPSASGIARPNKRLLQEEANVPKASTISVRLNLNENEEVLVLAEYLQSSSRRSQKQTQWFLNAAIPYSCLLSGMFMLTRVRSPKEDEVVLSATKDPLSELCVIDLPEGAAFVCQPRSLAGVVQYPDRPIRITRHWRLGTLQSWITLQLRYLVFHGPGKLIMKGCRGVRVERAGRGRLINQAATLGFDANLAYGNTRCETFMSYWTGKDSLFNDLFSGEAGSYVYEEVPDLKHKSGITGRGLEGVGDAVLKVFGV